MPILGSIRFRLARCTPFPYKAPHHRSLAHHKPSVLVTMIPDVNPYRRGPTPSPPRRSGVDMESASLLDEETKAMRARVIAHLMLPIPAGGGLSLNRLVANLRERVESSCEKIYRDGKPVPEIISANYIHIHSWLGYKADIFQGVSVFHPAQESCSNS